MHGQIVRTGHGFRGDHRIDDGLLGGLRSGFEQWRDALIRDGLDVQLGSRPKRSNGILG